MAEPKHIEGGEREQSLSAGQPTGLGDDRFWNEVGNIEVTAKGNEKGTVGSPMG